MEEKINFVVEKLLADEETFDLGCKLNTVNKIRLAPSFSMLDFNEDAFFDIRKDTLSKNVNIEFLNEVFDFFEAIYLAEKIASDKDDFSKFIKLK